MSPSVYTMTKAFQHLNEQLSNGKIQIEDAEDTIESLGLALTQKCENIIAFSLNVEGDINQLKVAKERIEARMLSKTKLVARLQALLLMAMESTGTEKVETPQFLAQLVKNPPSVQLVDNAEEILDDRFLKFKTTRTANKKALKAALKEGESIPGAELVTKTRVRLS